MSTQHHSDQHQQEDTGLTTMMWLGGALLVVAVVSVAAAQPAGPSPADVVRRAIDAHGGLEVLKKYPAGASKIAASVLGSRVKTVA